MLDSIIYRLIDWCITKLEKFREWRIERSLPKIDIKNDVKKWRRQHKKSYK